MMKELCTMSSSWMEMISSPLLLYYIVQDHLHIRTKTFSLLLLSASSFSLDQALSSVTVLLASAEI